MTRVRPCSSPSARRRRSCPTGSSGGAPGHPHVVAVDLDVEGGGVVGPRIERAARRQVEAGVVPVAGEQAGLDRALVEREAEVGAAVLDGPRPALVPQHHHRHGADLGEEAPVAFELGGRSGPDPLVVDGHASELSAPAGDLVKRVLAKIGVALLPWRNSSPTPSAASSSGSSASSRPPRPSWPSGFGLTDTAVRQHLEALEALGLVERSASEPAGRGRPPVAWHLTSLATSLFPDRHGDLTVELLGSIRTALGEEGLTKVIGTRAKAQEAAYRRALPERRLPAGRAGEPPGRRPLGRGLPGRVGARRRRQRAARRAPLPHRRGGTRLHRPVPERARALPAGAGRRRRGRAHAAPHGRRHALRLPGPARRRALRRG